MKRSNAFTINFVGLPLGKHTFEWDLDQAFFESFGNTEVAASQAHVELVLEKFSNHLHFDVHVTGEVTLPCDHCGDECQVALEAKDTLIARYSGETDLDGDEVLFLGPSEHAIDLSKHLYEIAVLAIPFRRVHISGKCNPVAERYLIQNETETDPRWDTLNRLKN